MPDFATSQKLLLSYLKARIPLICLRSEERARAMELFQTVGEQLSAPIYVHTLTQGTRELISKRVVNDDRTIAGALEFSSNQMLQKQNLTFVLTEVQDLENDNATTRHLLDLINSGIERGGTVCVITAGEVWPRLQRVGMTLSLEAPNEDEMCRIVGEFVEQYRNAVRCEWEDEEIKKVAVIMAGFTKLEAENQLLLLVVKASLLKSDVQHLAQMKDRMFANISGLERVNIPERLPIGGLEGLTVWLQRQEPLLTMDLRARGMRPPRGMLLVGVPGCGKSLSAKAVASRWKLALYRLDLANIHGQFLGQSESRLKEALAIADRLAPCILWIDEIEKGLAGGGDGGTSSRLVGHFLYWLQESPARVFVVSTANDITKLPPELFRRGRFDEIFFVDLPSASERAEIITIYAKRYLDAEIEQELMEVLVEISDGFAGSDLEAAVADVAKIALVQKVDGTDATLWRRVFTNIVPLSQTNPEQIESIRVWGRERAVPASGRAIGGAEAASRKPGRQVLV